MYYNNKKLFLSIFWIAAGAVLLWLSIAEVLDSSLYAGMGGALITVGVLQVIRNLRDKKDSAYRERIDTELSDERSSFLRMKSWSWAGYTAVLVEGIGVIAAMILKQHTVQFILANSVCLIIAAYWISYMILRKKY